VKQAHAGAGGAAGAAGAGGAGGAAGAAGVTDAAGTSGVSAGHNPRQGASPNEFIEVYHCDASSKHHPQRIALASSEQLLGRSAPTEALEL
jgi:hypothetical protein